MVSLLNQRTKQVYNCDLQHKKYAESSKKYIDCSPDFYIKD